MKTVLRYVFLTLGGLIGVAELVALSDGIVGDTASEFTWDLPLWGRIPVALFCLWLALHFGFKILPRPKKVGSDRGDV